MRLLTHLFSHRRRGSTGADPSTDVAVRNVQAAPSQTRSYASHAMQSIESGRLADALALADGGLESDPENAELLLARALVLFAWGRYHEAHESLLVAMRAGANGVDAQVKLGWTCLWLGRVDEAADAMRRATELDETSWGAVFGLASALREQGGVDESRRLFERAAALDPGSAHCLSALVACHVKLADYDAAERVARRCVAQFPERPGSFADLGMVLCSQGRHDEAIAAFEHAEKLQETGGDLGDDAVNFAICLLDAGRTQRALAMLEERMRRDANQGLHAQYALALLIAGRFAEGWREYEFRWIEAPLLNARPNFVKPQWAGQDLRGKTILVWTEQGFGDFIQFVRYVPRLEALGATVVVFLRDELRELAKSVSGIDALLGSNEPYPPFDYYVNLLSLPRIFGTDLASIPSDVPYLSANRDHGARWSRRIGARDGIKVGLVWAGSSTHIRDRFRSMKLAQLAPLLQVSGATFFSLQKGSAADELTATPVARDVVDLGSDLHDFAETAAAIDNLDLVVGVDTAVVHLAGALAKPVWTLSATPADWRWLEEREDSPWYPTMRVFRQSSPGRWDDAIARAKVALEDFVRAGRDAAVGPAAVDTVGPVAGITVGFRRETRIGGVAETRHGIVQYFPDDAEVATAVEYYGEDRQRELDLVGPLLAAGSVVMEIDAGIGMHSLWLARHVGDHGHLFLYEDDPMRKQALTQNLRANGIANATLMRRRIRRFGVGDESIDELRLQRLDCVRMNDGATAVAILEGATETLWRLRPRLHVAVSDDRALTVVAARAGEFGYACWRCETPLYNPDNFNRRGDDRFAGRTALALVALPEEHDVQLALAGFRRVS